MARRTSFRLAALVILVLLCVAAMVAFRGVGRWLICEDALQPADVIVVLSGGMPWRAEEAARLFGGGDGHEVWVTKPLGPSEELASMGVVYEGEDYFSRETLLHRGVPDADVHVLPEPIIDTQQEVELVSAEMRREGKTSVIFVTSPQHTRRVRTLWRKLAGQDHARVIVRAAYQDPFDADHWWRNTRDTFSVVRELMGLANAWAGLPVHPHSQHPGS